MSSYSDAAVPATAGAEAPVTPPAAADTAAPAVPAAAPPALREDQIQNAVSFLTHPKVRDSTTASKRSFLERKGLSTAEIDEAFKRAPEPPAASGPTTLSQPVTGTSTGLITYQQSPAGTSSQQGAVAPSAHPQQYQLQPYQQQAPQPAVAPTPEPLRWSQVLLGVGAVAASVYAVKSLLYPHAQAWYTSWVEKSRAQREAHERQAAALQEAAEALKACQVELRASSEAMNSLVLSLKEQQQQQASAQQASELSSMRRNEQMLQELSNICSVLHSTAPSPGRQQSRYASSTSAANARNSNHNQMGPVYGPTSPAYTPTQQYYTPQGSSYISSAPVQSHTSSFPSYPGGSDSIPPPPMGYIGGHAGSPQRAQQNGSYEDLHTSGSGAAADQNAGIQAGQDTTGGGSAGTAPPGSDAPYPPSFHEVMEMVSKGITPPNVRKDIKDTPPDPSRPLPDSVTKPAAKPWENRAGGSSNSLAHDTYPTGPHASHQQFAVAPQFNPASGFLGGGWAAAPTQPEAGGSSSSQLVTGGQPVGSSSAATTTASGSVFNSVFGDVNNTVPDTDVLSKPPALAEANGSAAGAPPGSSVTTMPHAPSPPRYRPPSPQAPTYAPVSVLKDINPAWKPPAAPAPTVLFNRGGVTSQSASFASSAAPTTGLPPAVSAPPTSTAAPLDVTVEASTVASPLDEEASASKSVEAAVEEHDAAGHD